MTNALFNAAIDDLILSGTMTTVQDVKTYLQSLAVSYEIGTGNTDEPDFSTETPEQIAASDAKITLAFDICKKNRVSMEQLQAEVLQELGRF